MLRISIMNPVAQLDTSFHLRHKSPAQQLLNQPYFGLVFSVEFSDGRDRLSAIKVSIFTACHKGFRDFFFK